jgi:ribosomal protein L32
MKKKKSAPKKRIRAQKGFNLVKYQSDFPRCPECGEAFCVRHRKHFFECSCIGPTQDDVIYMIMGGRLFGKIERKEK